MADPETGLYHPAMPASSSAAVPRRRRESKAARLARVAEIRERLAARYPVVTTALDHRSAWELLVATILSAQSTDVVVNQVTPELFRRYPTPADLAAADRAEVEAAIHATGFFRNKARSIQGAAAYLLEHHGGEVPETIDELVELPGVGRKTANVVLGTFFSRNDGRGGRHPRRAAVAAPRADQQPRPGQGRARPDGAGAGGGVDDLLPPPDLVRARGVHGQGPALRPLRAGRPLPLGVQGRPVREGGARAGMLVADAMTEGPVTVSPRATVAAAMSAMRRGRFRHLPVVAGTELVGVVSERDLETWPGAGVEVAESLADRPVAEVMTSQPVTVWPDEPVEVAARLLVDNAIGCLPVVAEEGLVGILTVSDLFSVLLRLLGGGEPSSRITLVLPDVPGALGRAMTVVGELGVNLLTVVTEPGPEPGTRGVVLRAGTINAAPVVAALVAAGFPATGPGRPEPDER